MSTYLTTTEIRQGSSNFKLCLDFRINGYGDTYLGQTWKVKIVRPDGTLLLKTSGLEVLTDTARICIPIDDFDLIQAGKYTFQVTLLTGGANVNSEVGFFTIESSLPEGLSYSIISSAQNYFPIFTSSGGVIPSNLFVNGGTNLEYTAGGAVFHGAVTVTDDDFDSGWNGLLEVPTKNAVYDKIISLTTANINASTNRNYVTDATAIINTAISRTVFLESYANLDAAVTAIGATATDLIVTSPTTTTTTSLTIPRHINVRIEGTGLITVDTGHTLIIQKFQDPGNKKCFVLTNSSTSHLYFGKGSIKEFNTSWMTGTDYGSTSAALFTLALNTGIANSTYIGDGRVYIPEGLWLSNGGHTITDNTSNFTIRGDGMGYATYSTTIMLNQANTFLFEITPSSTATQVWNVKFKDLVLDGQYLSGNTYGVYGHYNARTTIGNIRFEGVKFAYFKDGVYFNSNGTDFQVQAVSFDAFCQFETNTQSGLHIDSVNSAFNVEANFAVGNDAYAVIANHTGAIIFKGCEFAGVTQYSTSANFQVEKVTVVGSVTGSGRLLKSAVTGAIFGGATITVYIPVDPTDNTATKVATKIRKALDADPYITSMFFVGGSGADVLLIALDRLANDTTLNFTVQDDSTATGVTNVTTSTNVEAGVAINHDLAKAVLYTNGAHAPITFIGTQDEGFESSYVCDAGLIAQEINYYGCLVQAPIRMNATTRVNAHGCMMSPKVFRDGSASDSVVTAIGCNFEDVWRTLGNPSNGHPVSMKSNNFGHLIGNSHMAFEVGNQPFANYDHISIFRTPVKVLPCLTSILTEPMFSVGHLPTGLGLRIGRADNLEYVSYYYDIQRNNSSGYLDIVGNQTGFTGINVPGVVQTNYVAADYVQIFDEAYSGSWSGQLLAPTKNAIYNKVETLTGKRFVSVASSTTPAPNADITDMYAMTALTAGTTLGAPTGTPANNQRLVIRIKDDGTARSITYNAIYRAVGVTKPTTTVVNKTLYLFLIYNSTDTKWDIVDVKQE